MSNIWIRYIRARIKQNKNFIGCFVGESGSGKSYAALRMAQAIDPDFPVENVVYSGDEFMQRLEYISNNKVEGRINVLIWDEAGVGMASREFMRQQNKVMGKVLQTFRYLNIVTFFTTPSFSFIDVQARRMMQGLFIPQYIDFERGLCFLKALTIVADDIRGKLYYRPLSFNGSAIKKVSVSLPSDDLKNKYERISQQFKDEVRNVGVSRGENFAYEEIDLKSISLKRA